MSARTGHARDLADALAVADALVNARVNARVDNLIRALDRADDLVIARARALARVFSDGHAQREARRVAPSAAGLLAGAARLLPAADRARYAEEYRSELWDLAQVGAGRFGQLGYALRQLRGAPRTGLALRSPRRRGAAP